MGRPARGLAWWAHGKHGHGERRWAGMETNVRYNTGSRDFQSAFEFVATVTQTAPTYDAKIVVLPEGAAGWHTSTVERTWMGLAGQTQKTLYAGAAIPNSQGYDNTLVRITDESFDVVYRQRMPVPVSMWRPWSEQSAIANFAQPPAVMLDGQLTAVLICYEQLLVWPVLHARLAGADHILGVANVWWAEGTTIPDIQMAAMTAWARLFNMTLTASFNR